MSMLQSISIEDIRNRGSIRDADVARLRTAFMTSDVVTTDDADTLLRLHAACPIQAPQWSNLLVDVVSDYVVHQAEPEGYVVAENARWLIDSIGAFGSVETSTELMLLVHVLEAARWTPPSLAVFGLQQIRLAIETGKGPLRAAAPAPAGNITDTDVHLAARLISAFAGEASIAVTRAEADALFTIHRAITPGHATPAWQDLFVQSVGNAVLAATGHAVASRQQLATPYLHPEVRKLPPQDAQPLDHSRDGNAAPTIEIMPGIRIWSTAPLLSVEERAVARLERQRFEIITNEVIEEAGAGWLIERLEERNDLDTTEAALLSFVAREASQLPPELSAFAARILLAA